MMRFSYKAAAACVALMLASCGSGPQAPAEQNGKAYSPRDALLRLVDRYWDDHQKLNPAYPVPDGGVLQPGNLLGNAIALQAVADSLAMERRYLLELLGMPPGALDAEAGLTYEMFRRDRLLAIESYKYPAELLPVNPFDGVPQRFALAASMTSFSAAGAQVQDWQSRADSFAQWTTTAVANMREGMRRGYTLPRVVVERTLPVIAALGEDTPANVFYRLAYSLPGNVDDAQRSRGEALLTAAVHDKILPAYRALHEFLRSEYLPGARTSVGLAALPLGDAWYAFLVRRATGGAEPAAALHAQGVAEVQRLRARMNAVLAEAGFAGDAAEYLATLRRDPRFGSATVAELTAAVQAARAQTSAALPAAFSVTPHADFDVRKVESFRAATTPVLSYVASTGARNPALLYLGTAGLDARPAVGVQAAFLGEALPGRHWQLALQEERTDLPRFRRYGGDPAFLEGWSLYAVTLGDEMGLYQEPQAKFAALLLQLNCAAGLVLDTGLHRAGWTRQQALDYLVAQVPLDAADASLRVDRIIALPGQALSCTVGAQRFAALQARSQQALGVRFDGRAFHDALIDDGALPLDLLDARLRRWVDAVPKAQ